MSAVLAFILLLTSGERPGYFGFSFTFHKDPGNEWLIVRGIAPGGPAARGGLAPQDVITAINGKPLRFRDELECFDFLSRFKPGQHVRFSVIHNQKPTTCVIETGIMSDDAYERWQSSLEMAKRNRAAAQHQ